MCASHWQLAESPTKKFEDELEKASVTGSALLTILYYLLTLGIPNPIQGKR